MNETERLDFEKSKLDKEMEELNELEREVQKMREDRASGRLEQESLNTEEVIERSKQARKMMEEGSRKIKEMTAQVGRMADDAYELNEKVRAARLEGKCYYCGSLLSSGIKGEHKHAGLDSYMSNPGHVDKASGADPIVTEISTSEKKHN